MLRTLPVHAEPLALVAAGQPEPVAVWEEKDGRRQLTDRVEHDETTGHPLWTCYVMPTAAERPEVLSLRVPAPQQPVLTLFGPVHVEGLEVNVRVDKAGKLAQYWAATGIRDAGHQGRRNGQHGEQKAEQAA